MREVLIALILLIPPVWYAICGKVIQYAIRLASHSWLDFFGVICSITAPLGITFLLLLLTTNKNLIKN